MSLPAAKSVRQVDRTDSLLAEYSLCQQKLVSKSEALMILSSELSDCRTERDQFKLMAEQVREQYQVLKRQLAGHRPLSPARDDFSSNVDLKEYSAMQGQCLIQLLIENRDQSKSLRLEVDTLKQNLQDAYGDIKVLREHIARYRVGSSDEDATVRYFPAYEREDLVQQLELSREQYSLCQQKLVSKSEALMILSSELSDCRTERDQFKLMAEQVREQYQVLKRQLAGHRPLSPARDDFSSNVDLKEYSAMQGQCLIQLLIENRDQSKSLRLEVDTLKQNLQDAYGDIKVLREHIARYRVGSSDEDATVRYFPAYEREDLVQQLELSREQVNQLSRDLQQVLDEKEELIMERDDYRHKYDRLNNELNYILKGDERRVLDIDSLIKENKYMHQRVKQMEEERLMAMDTVTRYKSILERKRNRGSMHVGCSQSGDLFVSQKQVQQMLHSKSILPSAQTMSDLQTLCLSLLDSANDKSLNLSHQRKSNKILGDRVSELETKLRTLEVAGLWNVSAAENRDTLTETFQALCSDTQILVPCQASRSSETANHHQDMVSDLHQDVLSLAPSANQIYSNKCGFLDSSASGEVNSCHTNNGVWENEMAVDDSHNEELTTNKSLNSTSERSLDDGSGKLGVSDECVRENNEHIDDNIGKSQH